MAQDQQKRGFRIADTTETRPTDPENLFRDLKNREPEVQHLWSHQADILRLYDKNYLENRDVALELPTGAGKTLIGLLIGEYRRRKCDERVAYLCPTRQLAHQVGIHARQYGISASVCLTPDYDDVNSYRLGRCIAISTYSAVFNTNPRINDAQVLIMDDAHSGEDYIASLWSVSILRHNNEALYTHVLELLRPELGLYVDMMLDEDTPLYGNNDVDLVPQPSFLKYAGAFTDLLDQELKEGEEEYYPWSIIRGSLQACCVYVSRREILIRPVISPTMTHTPFAGANQRLYMSATLGEGGELERITGVRRIERIPMPEGWEKQGSGRRLFQFPNLSLDENEVEDLLVSATKQSNRALVLTPTRSHVTSISTRLRGRGLSVLQAKDIEVSLDSFTTQQDTALVLANRYDGIDLPGESCRLLVLSDLPAGINLQEQFLLTRLSATALLRDRLRTRFTQAVGRCTRGSTDYATVLVLGQRLLDFCARAENRSGMHPELQAEIDFGLENSSDLDADDFLDHMELLSEQGSEWQGAENAILHKRSQKEKRSDPLSEALMRAAPLEVDYTYAMWSRNYRAALEKAVGITDNLAGQELMPYRGWWYYLGGVAAWLGGTEYNDEELLRKSAELFSRAATCSRTVSWLAALPEKIKLEIQPVTDILTLRACEAVLGELESVGLHGKKFELLLGSLEKLINDDASASFEQGLTLIGKLLGFTAIHPDVQAAPDSVWLLADRLAVAFEAKSDETPEDAVSIRTVRESSTHAQWVRSNCRVPADLEIITVIITARAKIASDAQRNAHGLYYLNINEVRKLAADLAAVLRRVRSQISSLESVAAGEQIQDEFAAAKKLPGDLIATMKQTPLSSLPLDN